MHRIWLNKKGKNSGVSEVIATILLVSITVVITGVIWYWVQGYLPSQKAKNPTASAYVDVSDVDKGKVYIYIKDVNEDIGISDVEFQLQNADGLRIMNGSLDSPTVYGNIYIDSNSNGLLDDGDFFSFDVNIANNGIFVLVHKYVGTTIVTQEILV